MSLMDFDKPPTFYRSSCNLRDIAPSVAPIIIPGEEIVSCFEEPPGYVVFTNKRLIVVDVQGMTGRKQDITSLPFGKIEAFSIETAGVLKRDTMLYLWFSGLGKVRLGFSGNDNIREIGHLIASYVL